ncbi:MAG TPA: response regulator [Chloroflexota bacterium]|nr:response regulator [Chloroflexota bacterium]
MIPQVGDTGRQVRAAALIAALREARRELDFDAFVVFACERAREAVGADLVAILSRAVGGGYAWVGISGNRGEVVTHESRALGRGPSVVAISEDRIVVQRRDGGADGELVGQLMDAEGGQTAMAVPLRGIGGPSGSLLFAWRSLVDVDGTQRYFGEVLADYLAIVLENSRTHSESERRRVEAEALARLVAQGAAEPDPAQAIDLICEEGRQLLGADYARIILVENDDRRVWYGSAGVRHGDRTRARGRMKGPTAQALAAGGPLVFDNIDQREDFSRFHAGEGGKTALAAPFVGRQWLQGALHLGWRRDVAVTPAQLHLAETLAGYAAVVIENARSHADLEDRAAELASANVALEKASRQKSEFLASMSHELRTPLNAIIGFSEILLDPELNDMPAEQRDEFVGNIHRSGKHLLGIINDILDLSKVEAGHMEIHPEAVSLQEVIDACVSTIRPLADKKSIVVTSTCEPADVQAWADPARLKQVLYNLLSNAVKFTPAAGQVTVTADVADGQARVKVRDTGIGISPEDQELVFEDFRQVDQGVARQQEGTGLGLALVKRFVELHGGTVGLQSAVGQGSCFTVTLPLPAPAHISAPAKPKSAAPAAEESRDSGLTVLVVEDDDQAAELLTLHLRRAGYDVKRASSGDQALALARELHPFAVTLDVLMPEKDGWQVLSTLKADSTTAGIPVVLVTSVDNPSLGFALGAEDYLVKPIDKERLLSTLDRASLSLAAGGRMTVLIVDDDPVAAGLLETLVESTGGKALVALSGPEALRIVAEQTVDAVLLDLLMPGMSGFEVLEKLRQVPETSGLPVVVCTAKDLSEDELRSLETQVSSVLRKGVDVKQRVLDELIRLERTHPARAGLAGEEATLAKFLAHVNREASQAKRRQRSFSVLSLSCDDRTVAERLGDLAHLIAPALGKQLQRHDVLVHHASGEILVLLPECDREAAKPVIEKVCRVARKYSNNARKAIELHAGCATYPEDGADAQALLDSARRRASSGTAMRESIKGSVS